jgi:Xaa-Pro aminopeptidase
MTSDRLGRLRHLVSVLGLDGSVIRRPANVFYFTGFGASLARPSFAVVTGERVVLVVPGDADSVRKSLDPAIDAVGYLVPGSTVDRVADVDALSLAALELAIDRAGLAGARIGVEDGEVSGRHLAAIARRSTTVSLGETVSALRRIKDDDELALIRAAVAANDVGFAAAAQTIAAGVSEFDVQIAVASAMQYHTGVPIDLLDPNNAFISGPRRMLAAASATARRLERGDLMIVDINPVIRRYKGDTTRTFGVGPPTPAQQQVHEALVRGLEAAEKLGRPGVRACAVAAALQEPIIAGGYGSLLFHGGHAIGLEHLERPYFIPGDDLPLEEGMVIALEPGVYLPGVGGLRVEDNYLVTSHGLEALSHYPREITVCGDG